MTRATPLLHPASKAKRRGQAKAGSRAARPTRARKVAPEARRRAILSAALSVFAQHGFAAARLDDVAARAGVAKGTLYLYFQSKEALFEALLAHTVAPVIDQLEAIAEDGKIPPLDAVERMFALFQSEILDTDRRLVLRLLIAEGPRFPEIARFYHRTVLSRGLKLMRALARRAVEGGHFAADGAYRYPQLLVAPLIVAVIWDGLFSKLEPLDVAGMLAAHLQILAPGSREISP